MVDMYACFETAKLHRNIRDNANYRKSEMTANVMTQRHRLAKRYFFRKIAIFAPIQSAGKGGSSRCRYKLLTRKME